MDSREGTGFGLLLLPSTQEQTKGFGHLSEGGWQPSGWPESFRRAKLEILSLLIIQWRKEGREGRKGQERAHYFFHL